MLALGAGTVAIAAEVEEVMFGGASTRAAAARCRGARRSSSMCSFAGDGRGQAPAAGDRVTLAYDPADAVIVAG